MERLYAGLKEANDGVPFHAADCESDQDVYEGRDHANLRLYATLIRLLAKSNLDGLAVALNLVGYRSAFPYETPEAPYFFAFLDVMKFSMNRPASCWAVRTFSS